MIKPIVIPERLSKFSMLSICILLCIIFLFLSISSLIFTSIIDPSNFVKEHIIYTNDSVLINILILACILFLIQFLKRYLKNIDPRIASVVLILYTTILGIVWVLSVKSIPAADSGTVVQSAASFISGDYSPLKSVDSYFRYYPFQLGFAFICETLMRLVGTDNYVALGIINVLFLDAAFIALIHLSRLVFDNRKIELLTVFLLAGCLQPILLCTFIYGNIIGFAFSMWAAQFVIRYLKTGKKYFILLFSLFITIAVMAKLNYLIVLAAMCIILLLHFMKTRLWFSLLSILCAAALTLGANALIVSGYESRAQTNLGGGVPQVLWAAMGLQESQRAPGWYNGYTLSTFKSNNYNQATAVSQAQKDIAERLKYFSENPDQAITFFSDKVLSQWNEPTYESIWVSQVKKHVSSVPGFVEDIYNGSSGDILDSYFNIYQLLILIGFFFAMLAGIKKPDMTFVLLPLVILGGFLYHLIFEAKSQYILVYFVMLVPYSAYGLYTLVNLKFFRLADHLKHIWVKNGSAK